MINWKTLRDYWNAKPAAIVRDWKPRTAVEVKVVVMTDYGREWVAYWADGDWEKEDVAGSGDKISRAAAEALFPSFALSGLRYRG